MTDKEILELVSDSGFTKVALIDTADIVFYAPYRKACEANYCGNYNCSHSCPPQCGSPEEMEAKVMSHKKALVMQLVAEFKDSGDYMASRDAHSKLAVKLIEKLNANGVTGGLRVGSSGCDLCEECAFKCGKPCIYPDKMYSCLSAYCIDVQKLAEKCGMSFGWSKDEISFYGMYVFG